MNIREYLLDKLPAPLPSDTHEQIPESEIKVSGVNIENIDAELVFCANCAVVVKNTRYRVQIALILGTENPIVSFTLSENKRTIRYTGFDTIEEILPVGIPEGMRKYPRPNTNTHQLHMRIYQKVVAALFPNIETHQD